MEKRRSVFLTRLFRRSPQNSEFSEVKGWGDTEDEYNGLGSSSASTSQAITNGWSDEPPQNDYNGWGSVSLPVSRTPAATRIEWLHEKPKDEHNGWGSEPGSGVEHVEASSNGWTTDEPLIDRFNGWTSSSKSTTSKAKSTGWMNEPPEGNSNGWDQDIAQPKPVRKQTDIDVGYLLVADSRLVKVEPWAPSLVPSAPPLPEGGFGQDPAANVSDRPYHEGKSGDATCVVCWEGPVEGACVPCGHMASCMTCLHEIESKQGTCPVCRAKIDKVMRIYAV